MSNLYNLSAEVAALKEKLEASDLDAQTIADTLEAESFDFEEKCRAVGYVVKEFESKITSLEEAYDEMWQRKVHFENKRKSLLEYLQACMTIANVKKVEGVEFDISIRKNPHAVKIVDAGLVPESYWKIPEPAPAKLDKKSILKDLKDGKNVPGCQIEQTERVVIK